MVIAVVTWHPVTLAEILFNSHLIGKKQKDTFKISFRFILPEIFGKFKIEYGNFRVAHVC